MIKLEEKFKNKKQADSWEVELQQETYNHRKTILRAFVEPESRYRWAWTLLILTIVTYNMCMIPFRLAWTPAPA